MSQILLDDVCYWRDSIFSEEGAGWQNLLYLASITNRCFCAPNSTSLRLSFSFSSNLPQLIISLCSILNWNNTFPSPFSIFIVSLLLLLFLSLFSSFTPPPPPSFSLPLSLSFSNRASARFRRLIVFAWIAQNDLFSVAVMSVYKAVVYLMPVASYATENEI